MNDDELSQAYAAARAARRRQPRVEPPSPEALRSLVEGHTAAADREALLERALAGGAAEELALLHSVAAGVENEPAIRDRTWKNWWPMAAAATVILAIGIPGVQRFRDGNEPSRFRASGVVPGANLVSPANGEAASVGQTFVWGRLNLATEYTLDVMNDSGRSVAHIVTKDTTATLSASLPDSEIRQLNGWWVSATMPDGSQRRSELRLLRATKTP